MLSQEGICFAKMITTQKTTMSGEGRWMRCLEYNMLFGIDERFFFLRMTSPEEKYEEASFLREGMNYSIGKSFPSLSRMG